MFVKDYQYLNIIVSSASNDEYVAIQNIIIISCPILVVDTVEFRIPKKFNATLFALNVKNIMTFVNI